MKQIKLMRLDVRNFRGIRELSLTPEGESLDIMGANGTGKSSIRNAFLWLLFGKDAEGRKDESIKRREGGRELHRTDVEVEGVLSVDGESVSLRRIYREVWRKPRGAAEQVFDGHETQYYYNDTPVSMRDYTARIAELIDETLFRLITSPDYFTSLHWERQREQLFAIAGTISDAEIASRHEDFAILLDRLSGKSFKDYKSELSEKKRKLRKAIDEVQPRIDQTRKLMPEAQDWDDLEAQIQDLESRIARATALLEDDAKQDEALSAERRRILADIERIEGERRATLARLRQEAEAEAIEANLKYEQLASQADVIKARIQDAKHDFQRTEQRISAEEKRLEDLQRLQGEMRTEWHRVNAETFPTYGQEICCPHCGGVFDGDTSHEERKRAWHERKAEQLDCITREGKHRNAQIAEATEALEAYRDRLSKLGRELFALEGEQEQIEETLERTPRIMPRQIDEASEPELIALDRAIEELRASLPTRASSLSVEQTKAQRAEWQTELEGIKTLYAGKATIERGEREIEKLEGSGRVLAEQLAALEREEFTMAQFSKVRIMECEARINSLFRHVSFQLFDYTNSGDEYECCIPIVGNPPYAVANTADRLKAGLDIITTLSRHHGICAPIFLDNRESVTEIPAIEAQIINLFVSPQHKTLTVQSNN